MQRPILLSTARWELNNTATGLSPDSRAILLGYLNAELGYLAPSTNVTVEPGTPTTPIAPLPDLTSKAKIALCVGHARANDAGAVAYNGVSEESYNNQIVDMIYDRLAGREIECVVIDRYEGSSYGSAMTWLAKYLKANNFTHAFEFHFNSAGPTAKGFEYLFWYKSVKGKIMAETFQRLHAETFLDKFNRGAEPLGDEAHERGVLFTSITHCPAIICEPFFGSNASDAASYLTSDGKDKLANFYANAIQESVKALAIS